MSSSSKYSFRLKRNSQSDFCLSFNPSCYVVKHQQTFGKVRLLTPIFPEVCRCPFRL